MRSATYLSPHTQNELISVMGKHIILKGINDELNTACFFALLADEVASHNVDILLSAQDLLIQTKTLENNF